MGSRTLPTECEHGAIVDWGDFGPNPDDGLDGAEICADCMVALEHQLAEDERNGVFD